MIAISLRQLADILGARLTHCSAEQANLMIVKVTTDSRQLTADCLFIALKGDHFDGHQFVGQAVQAGAAAVVVSHTMPVDIPQLIVTDTRFALGQLAGWVRLQLPVKVVALTGSSGKTSVKEMTAAILQHCGRTLYTAGNLNNDIGVPLTLLRLTAEHQFAVIELGANHEREIAYTTQLVKPDVALVNNIAAAHLEGFGSLVGVGRAKGEIFAGLPQEGIAIVNLQSHALSLWQPLLTDKRVWSFSSEHIDAADFYPENIYYTAQGIQFRLVTPYGATEVLLPLLGKHNIANALAAAALAMSVGADLSAVRQGLAEIKAMPGRLYPISFHHHQLFLDDTYNANVGSMTAAAEVLATMPGYRVMVVGDMGELGSETETCHRQVGDIAGKVGIDRVLSVGQFSHLISESSGCGEHFADKATLIMRIHELLQEHQIITILVKGSRSSAMEQVIAGVQENQQC